MFIFRLQKVLDYRRTIEAERQRELAEKKRLLDEENHKLQKLRDTHNRYLEEFTEQKSRGITIPLTQLYSLFFQGSNHRIKEQGERVAQSRRQVGIKRQELIEATKEKKILDKFKERKLKEYLKQEDRLEDKFLDELATIAYNRES